MSGHSEGNTFWQLCHLYRFCFALADPFFLSWVQLIKNKLDSTTRHRETHSLRSDRMGNKSRNKNEKERIVEGLSLHGGRKLISSLEAVRCLLPCFVPIPTIIQ